MIGRIEIFSFCFCQSNLSHFFWVLFSWIFAILKSQSDESLAPNETKDDQIFIRSLWGSPLSIYNRDQNVLD